MNGLNLFFRTALIIVVSVGIANAQEEQRLEFPGGIHAFNKYIAANLKYPEVANLVGLEGKVCISFVIEKNGAITEVKPTKCLGAGCESEAVQIISMSPRWKHGTLYGQPVKFQYTVPISFGLSSANRLTYMKNLKKSDYGFVFFIKSTAYSIDTAEIILGKSFDPATIVNVEIYDNPKYAMPDKKEVYLIVMKDS